MKVTKYRPFTVIKEINFQTGTLYMEKTLAELCIKKIINQKTIVEDDLLFRYPEDLQFSLLGALWEQLDQVEEKPSEVIQKQEPNLHNSLVI